MKKKVILSVVMGLTTMASQAIMPDRIKFNNETQDTIMINELLIEAAQTPGIENPEARVAWIGTKLLGTPYVAGTLEGTPEMLTVNMEEMDCTTYIDNVLALAYTIGEGRTSWRDFVYNLERLRYRQGEMKTYASRLHYVSDWVVDNTYRGNIKEATGNIPQSESQSKTIDFITSNRDKYPALKDSVEYARMRNAEIGYRRHQFPYIKKSKLLSKDVINSLHEGDVIAITTKTPGLDVQHMGILVMKDGVPYLMHASSAEGKVVVDKLPLSEYLRRNRTATGIRVIRLRD